MIDPDSAALKYIDPSGFISGTMEKHSISVQIFTESCIFVQQLKMAFNLICEIKFMPISANNV
jgi:hypothetical protein